MKYTREDGSSSESQIRVMVDKVCDGYIECSHTASNLKLKAFYRPEMKLAIGQVVLLEYSTSRNRSGYIVVDDLSVDIVANVIEAQHMINNRVAYVDLIIENVDNRNRVHFMVDSSNRLFCKADTLIKGDKIILKINNGSTFDIELANEDSEKQ